MSADTNLGTSTNTAKASDDDEADFSEIDYRKIPYMFISSSKVTMEQAVDLAKLENKRPTEQDAVCIFDYMNYLKNKVLVWARDKFVNGNLRRLASKGWKFLIGKGFNKILLRTDQ